MLRHVSDYFVILMIGLSHVLRECIVRTNRIILQFFCCVRITLEKFGSFF